MNFVSVSPLRLSLLLSAPIWCCGVADAMADCAPAATSGGTVTCSGTNLPAFIAANGVTNLALKVAAGASITGSQNVGGTSPSFIFSSVQVNDDSTVVNAGTISNNGMQRRDNIAVNLAGTDTTLVNNGTISANYTTAGTSANFRIYGVNSSAPDGATFTNVQITNNGSIMLAQSSAGVARAIYSGENIDSLQVDNFGTIAVTKIGNATATAAVAAVDSDDDTDTLVVNNHAGAKMTVTGGNTYTVGGRAQDYTIQNDGTITNTGGRAAILVYGGSDDGAATATIDNSKTGVITGNVSITDTSPFGTTLPTTTAGTRDSSITNEGLVTGSFIYGSGTHGLDNSGTITGNLTINQLAPVGVGGASFTLTNEGTLGGNIAINDRVDSVNTIVLTGTGFNPAGTIATTGYGFNSLTLDGVESLGGVSKFSALDLVQSNVAVANGVTLQPNAQIDTTIFGPGGTLVAPSTNLGSIQGTLTLAGATNITPTFAAIARNGDVYALASAVGGAGAGAITVDGTALVSFTPNTTTGALLLETSVRDARSVAGISTPGARTLNALLSYSGSSDGVQSLGGAVEMLGSDAEVAQAARALSPIVNGADVQIPINSTMMFHQQIDARLDSFIYGQIPASGRSADLGVPRQVPVYGALPINASWIEGIGGGLHQGARDGVDGYNADLTGVIGGYDRMVLPNVRVGVAVGFIDGRVNGNSNLSGNRESIQTYQGLAYATYEQPNYYLRGSFGYGGVDFHDNRSVSFVGFSDNVYGSHKGNILTARGEAGLPIEYQTALLLPYAAFTYSHLNQDGYTESSSNGAGLSYDSASNDSDRGEIGGKVVVPLGAAPLVSYVFPAGSAVAVEGRAAYVREFGTVAQTVAASFVGGGSVFVASGPVPDRNMLDYGVGIRMGTGPVQIDASYNGLARTSYLQQVGLLRLRYAF